MSFLTASYKQVSVIFKKWLSDVKSGAVKYDVPYLTTNVNARGNCGPTFLYNDCLAAAMPNYHKCIMSVDYPEQELLYVHAFIGLHWNPSPALARSIRKIRARLSLPELGPGTEPRPGAWGLRTPGYYILVLHFRGMPGGFEVGKHAKFKKTRRIRVCVPTTSSRH